MFCRSMKSMRSRFSCRSRREAKRQRKRRREEERREDGGRRGEEVEGGEVAQQLKKQRVERAAAISQSRVGRELCLHTSCNVQYESKSACFHSE